MKNHLIICSVLVLGCNNEETKKAEDINSGIEDNRNQIESNLPVDKFFDLVRNDQFNEVEKVLESGYSVNIKDQWGNSAIHNSLRSYDMTKVLIDRGIDVNAKKEKNTDQQTPLHIACISDSELRIVKLLLESGADPTIVDVVGKTPLDYAVENAEQFPNPKWGFTEKARLLKAAKAELDQK